MQVDAQDRLSYEEEHDGKRTLYFSTSPICYKNGEEYKPINLTLKEKDNLFVNEENCLQAKIGGGEDANSNLELTTDTGFSLNMDFLQMTYDDDEVIHYPYKRYTFLSTTRDGKPILVQPGISTQIVDEYQIDKGKVKKSIVLESPLPSPKTSAKLFKVTHRLTTNVDTEIICHNEVKTSDFNTTSYIKFSPLDGDHLPIILREPELFDSNYTQMPIYYEFKFIDKNTYELSYVISLNFLTSPDVKYPVVIDPTATVTATQSTVGTSSKNFYIGRKQEISVAYDLYGYNDGAKSPTYSYTTLTVKKPSGTNLLSKKSGTNSRESGTAKANASTFGTYSVQIEVTKEGYDGTATVTYLTVPTLSWSSFNAQSTGSTIKAATMKEAYQNVKKVVNEVSASWTWHSDFPVSSGTSIKIGHLTNLRGALDAADSKNTCVDDSYDSSYRGDLSNDSYDGYDSSDESFKSNNAHDANDGYYQT